MKSLLLILFSIFMASASFAQDRKVEINFDDELVKGDIQKPELFYLLQRKQFNFKRMIQLRENFLPEMKSTGKGLGVGGVE